MGRSCGNRHCPTCQQEKTRDWLEKQTSRLLPCPYFLLTFTLPSELRCLARGDQRAVYNGIFHASSQAIRALAADHRFFGDAQPGFSGVLHTWDRTLGYHPHVHYVVPGGAVGGDGNSWIPSAPAFFLPDKALSILFRAKFREELGKAGLLENVDRPSGSATGSSTHKPWANFRQPAGRRHSHVAKVDHHNRALGTLSVTPRQRLRCLPLP